MIEFKKKLLLSLTALVSVATFTKASFASEDERTLGQSMEKQ